MELVVGCPVRNREWILPSWLAYVESACELVGIEPTFAFVLGTSKDNTDALAKRAVDKWSGTWSVIEDPENQQIREGRERHWNTVRYGHMVTIRNELLRLVRMLEPEYFLSLDSDILLNPEALECMLESASQFDAVGGKTFMTPHYVGRQCPSYAMIKRNNQLHRPDQSGVFKVDVIMAIKLMTPEAYHVDYRPHDQGEDIGWSLACKEKAVTLGWDGRIASKHVMKRGKLEEVDPRVGY